MSEPTAQQKANLARIRDNQRRSRARRKEYLHELETKYRTCEAVGAEASAEIQAAARKVLEENKRLRRMLRQQGFSEADIDGSDTNEAGQYATASALLDHMLATRKTCRPSSDGACGDSISCKTEDDTESRRQSCCASAPAASVSPLPSVSQQQQQQLQPVAPAPAPALAPAAVAPRPPSHEPPPQHQHVQQLQHPPTSQHHQQPLQYQSHPIQPQAQQQYYMSPPSSHAPATPLSHSTPVSHPPQNAYIHDYSLYAPQPYAYSVPASQLLDWDVSSANRVPNTYASSTDPSVAYASPTSGYEAPVSYASPTTATAAYSAQDNTSSCFVAADAIRAMHVGAGPEVEAALGCRGGSGDCRVNNAVVFDLMDQYSSAGGQQPGL